MCFLSVSLGWCLPEISSVKSVSVCMSTWRIHLGDRVIHLSLLLKACVCVCVHESVCVCVCLSASVWECASVFLCSSVCVFLCWLVSL